MPHNVTDGTHHLQKVVKGDCSITKEWSCGWQKEPDLFGLREDAGCKFHWPGELQCAQLQNHMPGTPLSWADYVCCFEQL